uniref:Retrovirus-related Pol polyprotein from transposon 17.6 n=1 Tax=Cajanus cajan TaxID=3821 RepID=A0A151U2U7_CAJCA|nr:Retrovirus-related Pol polyprotein from transposon 17.6 [Cajanus cajan]
MALVSIRQEKKESLRTPTDLHVTYLGSNLSETEKHEIEHVIRKNKDLFAWRPTDMPDRLVDGAAGHKFLTFLDAYLGYNQIRMHPRDEDKTTFVTESTNYCYQVMPFDLKIVRATYQQLMDKIFGDQIGKNMEVYVHDMVVKSADTLSHVADLAEVFHALRRH